MTDHKDLTPGNGNSLTSDPVVKDALEHFGHDDDQPDMDVGHEVTDDDRLVGHDEQEHLA